MSRLSLALDEIRNALRVAQEVATAAGRDAALEADPAEKQRLLDLEQRYDAIVKRLERTLLDRERGSRPRNRVR